MMMDLYSKLSFSFMERLCDGRRCLEALILSLFILWSLERLRIFEDFLFEIREYLIKAKIRFHTFFENLELQEEIIDILKTSVKHSTLHCCFKRLNSPLIVFLGSTSTNESVSEKLYKRTDVCSDRR